ncbi:MAG: hypothetical protein J5669_08750 [Bacteroidales bacterium]|nr:hypothetical protein [Bacteroidales bacterium]
MRPPFLCISALLLVLSCAPVSRIRQLKERQVSAQLALSDSYEMPALDSGAAVSRDTIVVVDPEGNRLILMQAVQDEDGEMVAHEVLQAARVTARFRNVAERGGRVDLRFQILVPREMQDGRWQIRLYPDLFVLEDSIRLEPVLITGAAYRKAQLRGYQQYQRFLDSIAQDSLHFVDRFQLENFLRRNIPSIYRFRSDSSYVSDECFASAFGVTEQEALEHYTNQFVVRSNRRKIERKGLVFSKLVSSPILTEGLRLDTVMQSIDGDFVYEYVQSLKVKKGMRKASIVLSGDVYDGDRPVYRIPPADPLTFYISSISGLADQHIRYKTLVIERKVQANNACYIEFAQGKDEVCEALGNNAGEIARIRSTLASLLENRTFDLDSIVVTASCSPEGDWASNRRLSVRRSRSVSAYFDAYIAAWRDSAKRSEGVRLYLGVAGDDGPEEQASHSIRFLPRSNAENWPMLDVLVEGDRTLSPEQKRQYADLAQLEDPDRREHAMQEMPCYRYMREVLYPRLRVVKFDFHLTRKGLQKDTVHTTVVDSVYMEGLAALQDRDYERAVTLLRPYQDYNAAVAYAAMDYNASARAILQELADNDKTLYLKALLYARGGDEASAVESYLKACRLNPAMIHRGNLDPEISNLIQKYKINHDDSQ